jgi:hypothetical protein
MCSPTENKNTYYMDYSQVMATIIFLPKMWQGWENEYMHLKAYEM